MALDGHLVGLLAQWLAGGCQSLDGSLMLLCWKLTSVGKRDGLDLSAALYEE